MWSLLRQPNFRRFWSSQVLLALGDGLMQMGILKIILDHRYNAQVEIAKMSFAVALPGLVCGPLAMSHLGRWQRRRVLLLSDALRAVLVVLIGVWILPLLTGRVEQRDLLVVYWLIGAIGVIATFYLPARSALIPNLVETDQLVPANTLFAISFAIATVGGRVVGGAVAEKIGVPWTVALNVVTCLASVGLLWRIRMTPHAVSEPTGNSATSVLREFRVALIYLWEHPTALPLVMLSGVFAFVLGILMVVFVGGYAKDVLHLGVSGIGYLVGAGGAGAAIGILLLGRGRSWTKSPWLPVGLLLLAAGALLTLSGIANLWLVIPVVFVLGGVLATVLIAIDSRLQAQVEDVQRSAVFAARGMLTSLTMIVAFWLQFGTEVFKRTSPPVVLWWLGIGTFAAAVLMLLALRTRATSS